MTCPPSDRSSLESEGSTSASNEPDGTASGKSSSTPGAEQSSLDIGPTFRGGTTRRRFLRTPTVGMLNADRAKDPDYANRKRAKGQTITLADQVRDGALTSSLVGSPASPFPTPADDEPKRMPDGSGPSSLGSFAYYDLASSSWRTLQVSLLEEWATFSENWPRSGTTRSGIASRRQPSVPLTSVTESLSWHTPTASDKDGRPRWDHRASPGSVRKVPVPNLMAQVIERFPTPTAGDAKASGSAGYSTESGRHSGTTLTDAVVRRRWPTPKTPTGGGQVERSTPDGGIRKLEDAVSAELGRPTGALNPTWVEWLMGFPAGWTDLGDSVMRSSRKSPSGSAGGS
jgi:hypothetical protein